MLVNFLKRVISALVATIFAIMVLGVILLIWTCLTYITTMGWSLVLTLLIVIFGGLAISFLVDLVNEKGIDNF